MSFLHCPRCRLALDTRGREPVLQYCPRCASRTRTLNELIVSASPAYEGRAAAPQTVPAPAAASGEVV